MRRWGWLCLGLFMAAPALAQDIPPALKDWQAWVLHDTPKQACPVLMNNAQRECVWSGPVRLDVRKEGAQFTFETHVDAPSWVHLPGDGFAWPQQVTVEGKPVAVLNRHGIPAVWLTPGDYHVRGEMSWQTRPTHLFVSDALALIELTLDGAPVAHIERNGSRLTLGEAAANQREADALNVRVYRGLDDGLPAMLDTRIQVNVTGSAREQLLGPALPKGFVATSLESGLPVRLESDGRLRMQLRPGDWEIRLQARSLEPLSDVSLTLPASPWPRQEIWSYADSGDYRSSRAEGDAVDAAQSGVPDDLADLPAFALDDTHGLRIMQGVRNGEGDQGDQITLHREMWLSFDGSHYTARDMLSGELRRSLRLDVAAPWQLQSATQNDTPLLITKGADGRSGVELRQSGLDLEAGLRVPRGGATPVNAWQVPLESVDAQLHLPHGYRLLGAPGADGAPDTWMAQWSLLDLFIVAVMTLLAWRLLGWRWALAAAVFLVLSQHEGGAPRWTIGLVLALALLARALPAGRLEVFARMGASALLALAVLWSLPFAAQQMKFALHPQLEGGDNGELYVPYAEVRQEVRPQAPAPNAEAAANQPLPPPPAPPAPPSDVLQSEHARALRAPGVQIDIVGGLPPSAKQAAPLSSVTVMAQALPPGNRFANQSSKRSVVQAGAGEPGWEAGRAYTLHWSGPVTSDQTTRLVIAPAWLVRLLRVLMLVMLALTLWRLVRALWPTWQVRSWGGSTAKAAAASLLLLLVPHMVHAQSLPDQDLLNQLRARLNEAPACMPSCASLAAAQLQATGDRVTLDLEYHTGAAVAVRLPIVQGTLALQDVQLDGKAGAPLSQNGGIWVRLERGVHRVSIRYAATGADAASLSFALRPERVTFSGQGWKIDGVDGQRALGDSLALSRIQSDSDGKEINIGTQAFPAYVTVHRTLMLDVDWTVETIVTRVAPDEGGFSLSLPLLKGEHPLEDDTRVRDGHISVTFDASKSEVRWSSRLDHDQAIALSAPPLGERAETWEVQASPTWHVEGKGVPTENRDGAQVFHPLPGEQLTLTVIEPTSAGGDSLAFDDVDFGSAIGDRATELSWSLTARSTRGGEHSLAVPKGAELLEVMRDGDRLSLALRDDKLSLPLLPGKHRYDIKLRLPEGMGMLVRTPSLSMQAPTANASFSLRLPQDRWVLWTWGPQDGPAVLYWSQLIVLLVAAWLLGRFAPTPLRFHHWLLLGLGFSAFAWSAFAFVAAWLIVFGLRERMATAGWRRWVFNTMQVLLAIFTTAAVIVLVGAVPQGLLGMPDMHVAGNGSTATQLRWFVDEIIGELPHGGVVSVSLWVYKIAMLAWALWLANALIGWLRWVFQAWSHDGYWRRREPSPPPMPPVQAEP